MSSVTGATFLLRPARPSSPAPPDAVCFPTGESERGDALTDEAPRVLRIGVRCALTSDAGELFADARAIEAAGADSLWADAAEGDPYVLLAALAASTWRVGLVAIGAPTAASEARRATCERLARGRLRVAEELAQHGERWVHVPFPSSRDEWRAARAAALESGATGIVVANDPRLLDLLRNPDQTFDRADMNLATG